MIEFGKQKYFEMFKVDPQRYLKPCPNCGAGSERIEMWDTPELGKYSVFCNKCGYARPSWNTIYEAVDEWNMIERGSQ